MNKIKVMLIDDHNILRTGVKLMINAQPDMEVVAESDSTRDIFTMIRGAQPDLILLDLTLPGGPSIPVIEKLSALASPPRVLVLTMHDDPAYVRAALGAGAKGFITKTVGEAELLQAIRAVCSGRLVVDLDDEAQTAKVFQSLNPRRHGADWIVSERLSSREAEVLRLLGQGFSNQNIAEQLDLSPKTVATYRARIGEKLGLRSTAEFVKYCVDIGMTGAALG